MAELCGDECCIICDFCSHYTDFSEINGVEGFDGEGICDIDNNGTDACNGCDNFRCFKLDAV